MGCLVSCSGLCAGWVHASCALPWALPNSVSLVQFEPDVLTLCPSGVAEGSAYQNKTNCRAHRLQMFLPSEFVAAPGVPMTGVSQVHFANGLEWRRKKVGWQNSSSSGQRYLGACLAHTQVHGGQELPKKSPRGGSSCWILTLAGAVAIQESITQLRDDEQHLLNAAVILCALLSVNFVL